MQKIIFTLIIICFGVIAKAQGYDSIPPYQKDSTLPAFSIIQGDSTWFSKAALPANTPVILVYFNPECGHCQHAAEEFVGKMKKFKDVFFVWVSYHTPKEINDFAEYYKLNNLKNVRLGRDPKYFIPSFFRVKFTPFMAVYGSNGKLLQTYDEGATPEAVYALLHPNKS